MRSYSLSSAPGASTYRISVKQEPHGTASSWLNQHLTAGALLEVAAPRGEFTLDAGTGPVLLIAAGIGVTPVLAMLHQLAAARSQREVWWLYGARGPAEHPFAAEAHALLASLPHAREHVFYSAATPAERRRVHAAAGRLTEDKLAALGIPANASAYICGPASFMTDIRDALTALGVNAANIHTELFAALPTINPGLTGQHPVAPHQPPGPPGRRAPGHLRPQRHHHPIRQPLAQRAGPRRRLRRPHPVELPHRRLPHLHHACCCPARSATPPPAGAPRRRAGAHLLRPADTDIVLDM